MPDFALDDLTKPVSRAEVQAAIYEVLAEVGVNTTGWKSGAVVRTMIVASSIVLSALSELQARIARQGFLEMSEGKWLTLVAYYVYGVDRFAASFATGEVQLTNGGGGVYSFDADDLIFANADTGETYRNTEPVTIAALGYASVPIRASVAGTRSDAATGSITRMVTTVIGVECTNAAPLYGSDEETDAELRERARERLGALSPMGPWDAYGSAVRNATYADGTSAGVTRIRIVKDGYGKVTTYVADDNGAVTGEALAIVDEAIQRNAAPLAVHAVTVSATNVPISVAYEVWLYESALTDEQIEATIAIAIEAFLAAQPIGGNVIGTEAGRIFVHGIRAAIFDALPEIFQVAITTPAADVVMTPSDVAVRGVITATAIHEEPPPEGFGGAL